MHKNPTINRLTERRRERVATVGRLWLQGKSYRVIAEIVGVSRAQVDRDIRHAKAIWAQSHAEALEKLLSVELAHLDLIETEAWRGWSNSQAVFKEVIVETADDDDFEGGSKKRRRTRKSRQNGDANFLRIALDCVEKRSKILMAIKEESGESDDIVVQAVEVIVENREQAQQMLTFEDFRKIVKGGGDE